MQSAAAIRRGWSAGDIACSAAVVAVQPLHAMVAAPSLLFILTLTVMLFRPPGPHFFPLDRIAFLLLVLIIFLRASVLRRFPSATPAVSWPMLGLLLLSLAGTLTTPEDSQAWSVLAAKWVVPVVFFHLAGIVFDSHRSLRQLEWSCLIALGYLIFISVAFLSGFSSLVVPSYITNEALGIHADRARGPFLQAVANGMTLNLLGVMALDLFRRKILHGLPAITLLGMLPVAILATLTRSVWLSFAGSLVMLLIVCRENKRVRLACWCLIVGGAMASTAVLCKGGLCTVLGNRLGERSTVDYRVTMYQAGWEMFLEKPILGWGPEATQFQLTKRISTYQQDAFFMHNTYLGIVVEHGVIGLGLYGWMVVGLFRLGCKRGDCDTGFRTVWPVLLCVYLVNATFVVMNYQFVNGLLFTVAGILAARNRPHPFGVDFAVPTLCKPQAQ